MGSTWGLYWWNSQNTFCWSTVIYQSPLSILTTSHFRKYSLIQDQARELTHLREKIRIGRAVSSLLIQHVQSTVKIFEELLSSRKIDYNMEQHFREQLAKGSQLAESLASKFNTGKPAPGLRRALSPSTIHTPRPALIHKWHFNLASCSVITILGPWQIQGWMVRSNREAHGVGDAMMITSYSVSPEVWPL